MLFDLQAVCLRLARVVNILPGRGVDGRLARSELNPLMRTFAIPSGTTSDAAARIRLQGPGGGRQLAAQLNDTEKVWLQPEPRPSRNRAAALS